MTCHTMSADPESNTGSNPFSTRYIRPGAMEYIFPPGVTAAGLANALQQQDWRGSIIGPHGSGKSSLLTALRPELERLGRTIFYQQLHSGQHTVDWVAVKLPEWDERSLVIIDGYEQLSFLQAGLLRQRCHRRRAGLLVTAHQPLHFPGWRLPAIFTTQPSLELAHAIVQRLLPESDDRITPSDVAEAYVKHDGNLREMLLGLYDVFRQQG
jgi:hypothetical protein